MDRGNAVDLEKIDDESVLVAAKYFEAYVAAIGNDDEVASKRSDHW